MTRGPTVHVVDDEETVRSSSQWLLEGHGYLVETWPDAETFLARAEQESPGVILLDLRMPGMGGMAMLEHHAELIRLPVVVVTAHGDIPLAVRAVKAGALTMLEKPVHTDALLSTVDEAIEESRRRAMSSAERDELIEQLEALTPREREILVLLAHGHRNKTVGEMVDISHRTVAVHRQRILAKTASDTVTDLVHRISRHGLLSRYALDPAQPENADTHKENGEWREYRANSSIRWSQRSRHS